MVLSQVVETENEQAHDKHTCLSACVWCLPVSPSAQASLPGCLCLIGVCVCRSVCEHIRMCLGPGLNLAGSPQPDLVSRRRQPGPRSSAGSSEQEEEGVPAEPRVSGASRLHCALCLKPKNYRRSKRPRTRQKKGWSVRRKK